MKFIVDNKHREFFNEKGWIEFEGIVSPEESDKLSDEIYLVLANRLGLKETSLHRVPSDTLYLQGRDAWRDSVFVKNFVCQRTLAEIAAHLVEATPIRLGYDQVIMKGSTLTLEESSPMQGILCGVLVGLQKGIQSVIFLAPEATLDFTTLPVVPDTTYLLIVYCRAVTRYTQCEADPNTNNLKKLGYGFGDKLIDRHHPVLFR